MQRRDQPQGQLHMLTLRDRRSVSRDARFTDNEVGAQTDDAVNIGVALRRNTVLRALTEFPFHAAQVASLPAVACLMAATGGAGLFRQLYAAIAAGDPLGGIAVFCGATYALMATTAVSQIKEGMRASDHDNRNASRTEALHEAVQDVMAGQGRVERSIEGVTDQLGEVAREMARFHSGDRRVRKNLPELWANFARGSTVHSVNGQCRYDVISDRRVGGTIKLLPDYERLLNWVKRYGPNGVARANIILFADDPTDTTPKSVPLPIAYHLTAFRATKRLAQGYHAELHLDRVRFYLQKGADARRMKSFVVGEYGFSGGATVPFVNCYCDHAAMYNVPRTLLDDDVETSHSPDVVANYRHLAEALVAELPSYSLDDLERRYGHLVSDPDFDLAFITQHPDAIPATAVTDELVESGDHIAIRRRPRH
jgi:hypothetical protein